VKKAIKKANILIEALPYIKRFQNKVVVVKCGGRQMLNEDTINNILQDIVFMNCVGLNPVLVHGGGPSINEKMRMSDQKVEFHEGYRVTDEKALKIVIGELNRLNQRMVKKVKQLGAEAEGLSGDTGKVIKATRVNLSRNIGFVGKIDSVKAEPVKELLSQHIVPIISPLGQGEDGQIYNINADIAAAEIAIKLKAWKLVLLTDVQGIMYDKKDEDSLISTLKVSEIGRMTKRKIIQEGMVPKVNACIAALGKGVKKTHIIDGSIPRSLLLEIFTDEGIGTQII
jgi:acetylglutamate kinase